jgi:hypothetical protein
MTVCEIDFKRHRVERAEQDHDQASSIYRASVLTLEDLLLAREHLGRACREGGGASKRALPVAWVRVRWEPLASL